MTHAEAEAFRQLLADTIGRPPEAVEALAMQPLRVPRLEEAR